eukprot:8243987-Alexandrium_andersonii.AAC.1
MSASLVGSEMCIRDRTTAAAAVARDRPSLPADPIALEAAGLPQVEDGVPTEGPAAALRPALLLFG